MASKLTDNQRPRKRDRFISFLKPQNNLSAKSRSSSPNVANSNSGLPAGATSNSLSTHGVNPAQPASPKDEIHLEAFQKFQEIDPKAAAALQKLVRSDQSTAWHAELSTSIESVRQDAEKKRMKINLANGKPLIVSDLLEKLTQWVKTMVKVGDSAVQFDPVHAALPWAAFRFVLQVRPPQVNQSAINYIETENVVWDGIECVCKNLSWIHLQGQLHLGGQHETQNHLREAFLEYYIAMFKLLADLVTFFNTSRKVRLWQSPINSADRHVEPLEQLKVIKKRICDISAQVVRNDQIKNNEENQRILVLLNQFDESIRRMHTANNDSFKILEKLQRENILDWLSQIPYPDHFSSACDKALKGTGVWFFEQDKFKTWRDSSTSEVLRVHGGPGSGKSTLLSMVIRSFVDTQTPQISSTPVWFYCSRSSGEKERGDSLTILRCLLRQLSFSSGQQAVHSVVSQRHTERDLKGLPSASEAVELCKRIIDDRGPTFIFVDALDECEPEERRLLLKTLLKVLRESSQLVKLFVTSRDIYEATIQDFPEVQINANSNGADIRRYIEHELDERIQDKSLLSGKVSDELRTYIDQKLNERAEGMFRWVALQLQLLTSRNDEDSIKDYLLVLPRDLRDSYNEVFRIKMSSMREKDPRQHEVATRTFQWLLVANKHISPEEFCILVGHIDKQGQPKGLDLLLRSCFSLVEFDINLKAFKFCHLSVREFFEWEGFIRDHEEFHALKLHQHAATKCLDQLLQQVKDDQEFPLYPLTTWGYHTMHSGEHWKRGTLRKKLEKLLLHPETWRSLTKLIPRSEIDHDFEVEENYLWPRHPLLICCRLGLSEFVPTLCHDTPAQYLEAMTYKSYYPDEYKSTSSGPMEVAALAGHTDIVQMLLERKMTPEGSRLKDSSPLILASGSGHLPIVQILLKHNAEIDRVDHESRTALIKAAAACRIDVMELLLKFEASVNCVSESGTALAVATSSTERSTEAVGLLLEHKADVNAHVTEDGKKCETAIMASAEQGNIHMMEKLIQLGADVNLIGRKYGTTLGAAALGGHLDAMKLLLDHKADVNLVGGGLGTALGAAALGGHLDAMKLLLDHKADVNLVGGQFGTALGSAAWSGHLDAMKLLLDHKADVNLVGGSHGTALGAAAWRGHLDAMKLLLDHKADVNLVGGDFGTALGAAAWRGHLDAMKLLLDHKADVNLVGGALGTALEAAAWEGHLDAMKLLLDHKADVNLVGGDFGTALGAAAWRGHLDAMKLLVDRGASVNRRLRRFTTPLEESVRKPEATRFLLQHGAIVNMKGGRGGTALERAVELPWSRDSAVKLLIEHGAHLNAQGGKCDLVLRYAVLRKSEFIETLISHGADVNFEVKQGNALDLARQLDHDDVAEILLRHGAKHSPGFVMREAIRKEQTVQEDIEDIVVNMGALFDNGSE